MRFELTVVPFALDVDLPFFPATLPRKRTSLFARCQHHIRGLIVCFLLSLPTPLPFAPPAPRWLPPLPPHPRPRRRRPARPRASSRCAPSALLLVLLSWLDTDPLVRLSDAGCRRLRGCRQAQLGHRLQRCGPSPFFKAPASRRVRVADHRNRRAGALWRLQLVSSLMGRLQTRSDSCRQEARAKAATAWKSWPPLPIA